MMNPKTLMQLKPLLQKFQNNHPKVPQFFKAASGSVDENSLIEISLTTSQGKTLCTNMRVTADDLRLLQALQSQFSK